MHSLNFIEIGMGDAFIGSAQVFTDVSAEIIDPPHQKFPGDAGGVIGLAGEEPDGFGGADAIQNIIQRARAQVGKIGFFPCFLDAQTPVAWN